jgi:Fis family transcriptional regulator, factor for inversion stimulation protein
MSQALDDCVCRELDLYLNDLDDLMPSNLYEMFIRSVEKSLFEQVMKRAGSQVNAAQWLGINRSTLRKKLSMYGLLGQDAGPV